jgi:hypothetical protein
MTIDTATSGAPNIVERAKNILLSPRAEWARISTESTGLGPLLMGYVLPLAAIGALASVIGSMLFLGMLFGAAGLVPAVVSAAVGVGITLLGVFLCGILVNALASSFGSQPNQMRANQLAAYSATASLIGSWGAIIPFLGWLVALAGGIYSVVLFYMGLTPMMQTPEDKRVLFTIVLALIAIVAWWLVGMVVAMMLLGMGLGVGGAMSRGFSFQENTPQQQSEVTHSRYRRIAASGRSDARRLGRHDRSCARAGAIAAIAAGRVCARVFVKQCGDGHVAGRRRLPQR